MTIRRLIHSYSTPDSTRHESSKPQKSFIHTGFENWMDNGTILILTLEIGSLACWVEIVSKRTANSILGCLIRHRSDRICGMRQDIQTILFRRDRCLWLGVRRLFRDIQVIGMGTFMIWMVLLRTEIQEGRCTSRCHRTKQHS